MKNEGIAIISIPIDPNDPETRSMSNVNEAARRVARRALGLPLHDPSPAQVRAAHLASAAAAPGLPPSPADLEKIAAIASIVGTDPADIAATLAACWDLMGAHAEAEDAARRQLSARERTMLSGMRGVSAVAYLARKRGAR